MSNTGYKVRLNDISQQSVIHGLWQCVNDHDTAVVLWEQSTDGDAREATHSFAYKLREKGKLTLAPAIHHVTIGGTPAAPESDPHVYQSIHANHDNSVVSVAFALYENLPAGFSRQTNCWDLDRYGACSDRMVVYIGDHFLYALNFGAANDRFRCGGAMGQLVRPGQTNPDVTMTEGLGLFGGEPTFTVSSSQTEDTQWSHLNDSSDDYPRFFNNGPGGSLNTWGPGWSPNYFWYGVSNRLDEEFCTQQGDGLTRAVAYSLNYSFDKSSFLHSGSHFENFGLFDWIAHPMTSNNENIPTGDLKTDPAGNFWLACGTGTSATLMLEWVNSNMVSQWAGLNAGEFVVAA